LVYGPLLVVSQRRAISQRAIFETLVRTHQGALRAFLRRLTREQALADDLAQDTFMRALSRLDQLQSLGAAKPWLFQIAYRVFLDHYRKTTRQKALMLEVEQEASTQAGTVSQGTELAMDLSQAMEALPNECRACILLVLSEGLSHNEAAQITGLPLGTVKSHIKRGRERLQNALKAYGKEEEQIHDTR